MAKAKGATSLEARLARLGLRTDLDLALHLPLRYQDETRVTDAADLQPGGWAQLEGEIQRVESLRQPRHQVRATLVDATGSITLRWLHTWPGLVKQLESGQRWRISGEVRGGFWGLEILHPKLKALPRRQFEVGSATEPDVEPQPELTPIYPTTEGLTQPVLRRRILAALARVQLPEILPQALWDEIPGPPLAHALQRLHHPPVDVPLVSLFDRTDPAWQRVKYEELLAQQISLALARQKRRSLKAPMAQPVKARLVEALKGQLPFALTGAQLRVCHEIDTDLQRAHPMLRLLQGDVGSGKTVVAALAAARALEQGWQVALMAPTEVLLGQHVLRLQPWLSALGIPVYVLSGAQSIATRRKALQAIAEGELALVVGTQALVQDSVKFARLGLSIVDEQHRFGVGQRLALRSGMADGSVPHQLMMSATPIPRSLAMSLFADLDVSVIDERPPGRKPVVTKLFRDSRRAELITAVEGVLASGRQAYWVCPLVEESDALDLQNAVEVHAELQVQLSHRRIGLLHGRMSSEEKRQVMQAFEAAEIDLLVSTTVIEVGVDVPNATLMVIEHAERFGLAQLHQLRGRVGRGEGEAVCVLLYQTPLSNLGRERLRILHASQDGFEIAQRDLELRGPGEFLGARQSGLVGFRYADPVTDEWIADRARVHAAWLLQHAPEAAQAHLQRWLAQREHFLNA